MTTRVQQCPLWDVSDGLEAIYIHQNRLFRVDNSPRAGGGYIIPETLVNSDIIHLSRTQKARLTTWLVGQRLQGDKQPTVTKQIVDSVKDRPALSVHERAYRLLQFVARNIGHLGESFSMYLEGGVEERKTLALAYAWSESTEWSEITFCFEFLRETGLARGRIGPDSIYECDVTVAGYRQISELGANVDSTQAFVAMWFSNSMAEAYENGIEPGIREAGFNPLRIDQKDHANRIEDEIIAEIRRSRFLVADFTQGVDGARGGVYYEAGFAHGLGLPVIFTCHKDSLDALHFDTSHYNHIVWTKPDELREKLANRIRAVIGQGPVSIQAT